MSNRDQNLAPRTDPYSWSYSDAPWRKAIYNGPRESRCQRCEPCRTDPAFTCRNTRDPNPCYGCLQHAACWGARPCEQWHLLDESRHYAKLALQAYDNPSPSNRVDLLTQSPYRLNLEPHPC